MSDADGQPISRYYTEVYFPFGMKDSLPTFRKLAELILAMPDNQYRKASLASLADCAEFVSRIMIAQDSPESEP